MPIGDVTIYECDECGATTSDPVGWQIVHRPSGDPRVTCESADCNERRLARAMELELARVAYVDARARYRAMMVEQGHIGEGDALPEERSQAPEETPISADETT